jgi:HSP20 family protein
LTVKGDRHEERETKDKAFFLHERLDRSFERRFTLPDAADTEKIAAGFENGVLKVSAPKAAVEPMRTIPIAAA